LEWNESAFRQSLKGVLERFIPRPDFRVHYDLSSVSVVPSHASVPPNTEECSKDEENRQAAFAVRRSRGRC